MAPTSQDLITALLKCSYIKDRERREVIINALPHDIKHNITRNTADKVDVSNLVEACLNYPNGLQELIAALEYYEGPTSIPLQALKQLVANLPAQPTQVQTSTQTTPTSGNNFDMSGDFRNSTITIKSTITGQEVSNPPNIAQPEAIPDLKLRLRLYKIARSREYKDNIEIPLDNTSFPQNHFFGFALENVTELTKAKGVLIRIEFSNQTHATKAIQFDTPDQEEEWIRDADGLLLMEQMAIMNYENFELLCLKGHPKTWDNFKLTLWERLEGHILVSYRITSIEPHTKNEGELRINLS